MLEELMRAAMEAVAEAKPKASDHGDPEQRKFPIMSQAQVHAAAKLIGRGKNADGTPYSDDKKAKVKKRIIAIAKRKGFALPKSWQANGKESDNQPEMSDREVTDALQGALMALDDPDGDGDNDRDTYEYPYVCHLFRVADPPFFVFRMGWDGDYFRNTYTIDVNGEATLGDAPEQVRKVVTFVPWIGADDDEMAVEVSFAATAKSGATTLIAANESSTYRGDLFREVVDGDLFRESRDDSSGYRITGTAIMPGVNRSKTRNYPPETLAAAAPGFVGKKMYIDHISLAEQKNRPERTIRDVGAKIEKAWVNSKGGVDYEAVVVDPPLKDKLALMKTANALDTFGTSVNYQGKSTPTTIEGMSLENIDEMHLQSLDIVTEPGAWGDIARVESAASADERNEDDMDISALEKQVEALAKIVTTQAEVATADRQARIKSEARTNIRLLLQESKLPKASVDMILGQFKDAESTEGVEAVIAQHVALVESLTPKGGAPKAAAARRVERVVVGMGATDERAEADAEHAPVTVDRFKEDFARLMGGADKAEAFYNEFA